MENTDELDGCCMEFAGVLMKIGWLEQTITDLIEI